MIKRCCIFFILISLSAYGGDIIPLFQYENLELDSQTLSTPSLGLILKSEKSFLVGTYSERLLKKRTLEKYPLKYHSIDLLYEKNKPRGQWLFLFKSDSDKPLVGGWNTFQAAGVYGVQLKNSERLSIILGGGIGVSDFGIELEDEKTWPLLPVPFFRVKYKTKALAFSFDFITNPNLNFVIAPQGSFQLIGDLRMDQFRDYRDLLFELAFAYRYRDFAGIAVGLKNANYGAFELGRNLNDSLEIHYYCLFAEIDFTLLKFSVGHVFKGRELYGEEIKRDLGHGIFLSLQLLYPF